MAREPSIHSIALLRPSSYPDWICDDCGQKYGRRSSLNATWHHSECDVCGMAKAVTQPRDFGHLKEGWHLLALELFSLEVVKAASRGDQCFIDCLRGEDDATQRLRMAIVSLAEVLRVAF
jgi:hypothetical protein